MSADPNDPIHAQPYRYTELVHASRAAISEMNTEQLTGAYRLMSLIEHFFWHHTNQGNPIHTRALNRTFDAIKSFTLENHFNKVLRKDYLARVELAAIQRGTPLPPPLPPLEPLPPSDRQEIQ